METIELPYHDPELAARQMRLDDQLVRVAHESRRNKEAQEDLTQALDEFLEITKSKSA